MKNCPICTPSLPWPTQMVPTAGRVYFNAVANEMPRLCVADVDPDGSQGLAD
jgi:hypothetical protein